MPNQQDVVIEQLMALDKQTLATRAAKQLGKYQKEIAKRDRLIADLTAQRDKAQREANEILADARRQANIIKQEAQTMKDRSEQRAAEVDAEVDRKITNANAEADSIVETHLSAAKANISVMETRRDEAKRKAIALNKNIRAEYDRMSERLAEQISLMKDMQASLDELSADIESEDFKKFDMHDYITPATQAYSPRPSYAQPQHAAASRVSAADFDDGDLAVLGGLLSDDFDSMADPEPLEYPDVVQPTYTPQVQHQEAYPARQAPLFTQQPQRPYEDDPGSFEEELDFDDLDMDDDIDSFSEASKSDPFADADTGTYSNGKMKSFTDAFMAVGAQAEQAEEDDDIDFDSILDDEDDVLEDDDFSQPSRLNIPVRPQRSSGSSPARWITK